MDDVDMEGKFDNGKPNMLLGQKDIKALRDGENLQAFTHLVGPAKPVELSVEDLKNARAGKPDQLLKKLEASLSEKQ